MGWLSSIFRPFHTASQLKAMQRYATETETYIKSLELQVGTLREQIQTLDHANDRINDAYKAACIEREQLTEQLANAQSEISALRTELSRANKDLDTLDEINRMVDRFDEEREKYVKRIHALKNSLEDARKSMRSMMPQDADSEVTSISFNDKGIEPISYNKQSEPNREEVEDSNWLMDLPD